MILRTGIRALGLVRQAFIPVPFPGSWRYLRRLAVLCVFLPVMLILQVVHWTGFLIDEVLFRGYRRIEIRQPVFVIGVPRSGTTFLHRLLAEDPAFTSFSTWECIFAPSIIERYLWRGIAALDRRIGAPLGRLLGWFERQLLAATNDVHPTSLTAPEEDYLAFLPVLCCFILVVPFPEARWVWRMGRFDRDVPPAEKAALIRWYRRCLQKHLYVHGPGRTMLSKNASFCGMANSLVEAFPDARVIVCERDAVRGIASQFNSLSAGMKFFGVDPSAARFRRNLLDCLHFYYENLSVLRDRLAADRLSTVALWDLSRQTRDVLERIYRGLGTPIPAAVVHAVEDYQARSKKSHVKGRHKAPLSVAQWGLDPEEVAGRFARWRHDEAIRI